MSDDITQVRRAWENEVSELLRKNSSLIKQRDAALASHEGQIRNTLRFKEENERLRAVIRWALDSIEGFMTPSSVARLVSAGLREALGDE